MNNLFRRQLGSYAAVHRSGRNKATHFVGIPIIVFSLVLIATLWRIPLGAGEVSFAMVFALGAVAGWMALDVGIGLIKALVMLPMWYGAETLSALGPSVAVTAFVTLFVGGWALQLIGHHFEGKRPALVDNIFQAFIGPMFLVAEVLVAAGYRADLADAMNKGLEGR